MKYFTFSKEARTAYTISTTSMYLGQTYHGEDNLRFNFYQIELGVTKTKVLTFKYAASSP
jgi:hypothetical protein